MTGIVSPAGPSQSSTGAAGAALGALAGAVALGGAAGLATLGNQLVRYVVRRRYPVTADIPAPCFYSVTDSVVAGRSFDLHMHCPEPGRLEIRRLADRGMTDDPVLQTHVEPIDAADTYDLWRGVSWPAVTFRSESTWKPGLYLAELTAGSRHYRQALVVTAPKPAAVAVVLSTNTWAAYNDFGGLSNYDDDAVPRPLREFFRLARITNRQMILGDRRYLPTVPLPFHRPNARINADLADLGADPVTDFSHLVRAEWPVLRYLDQRGVDYNVYTDRDVAFGHGPFEAKLVIFAAHSEYWSAEMFGRFSSYVGAGGRALFLSGNNWYREVRFGEFGLEVVDQKLDPKLAAGVLGTGYTAEGYETSAPFEVLDAGHPVFEGLELRTADVFGGPDAAGNGASGHETDKVNAASGVVDVLAVGLNPEGPAFMTWKPHPGGGWVCNMSSVRSAPWVERCPRLGSVVGNIIDLALR